MNIQAKLTALTSSLIGIGQQVQAAQVKPEQKKEGTEPDKKQEKPKIKTMQDKVDGEPAPEIIKNQTREEAEKRAFNRAAERTLLIKEQRRRERAEARTIRDPNMIHMLDTMPFMMGGQKDGRYKG